MERCVCAVDSTTEVLFYQTYPDGADAASPLTLLHPFEVVRSLLRQRGYALECNVAHGGGGGVVYRHFPERSVTLFIIEAAKDRAMDYKAYQGFLQIAYQILVLQTGPAADFCRAIENGRYNELRERCAHAKGLVIDLLEWLGAGPSPALHTLSWRAPGFSKDAQQAVNRCLEDATAKCPGVDVLGACLLKGSTVAGVSSGFARLAYGHDFEILRVALPLVAAALPRATVRDFPVHLTVGQLRAVTALLVDDVHLLLLVNLCEPPCDLIAPQAANAFAGIARQWRLHGFPTAQLALPDGVATAGVFVLPPAVKLALNKDEGRDLWWALPIVTPDDDEPYHSRPPFLLLGDDSAAAAAAVAALLCQCIDALTLPLPPAGKHAAASGTQMLDGGVAAMWGVLEATPEDVRVAVLLFEPRVGFAETAPLFARFGDAVAQQKKFWKHLLAY
eukprot:TRINITY_DN22624_c0_g1_i1.p1 TRINITY_DN22624_c0_g1~~TRINITY_DN22624_c0_g1_i1.p1  ORF type:complete len:447 (+),score=179.74 TRINITY_DN22624_c0_g1_i1:32-1372(+)